MAYLTNVGFKAADSLPLGPPSGVETTGLRSTAEVAGRLWALELLFLYAADRDDVASGEIDIEDVLANCDAQAYLTEDEGKILGVPRKLAIAHHSNLIGWKLENMLPLAWLMGFDTSPSVDGEMIAGDTTEALLAFLPWQRLTLSEWARNVQFRSLEDVLAMEDLFYCAHNAVRSAQLGSTRSPMVSILS